MTKSSSALAAQNSIEESGHQRPNLIEWAELVVQQFDQTPAAHHYLLLHNLAAVSSGDIDRLMVLMPPGSAKSTYASIVFPVWWLSRNPMSSIIATSHTAGLAERFGRQARDLALERGGALGYTLVGNRPAGGHWQTSKKGEYFATGVRGPLTGRRADLVIIDDPIKSHLEADSPVLRERLWDWYRSDLTTRLKPKGSVVLIMTRWHEDDLGGRLLAQDPDEWRVLRLAALAEGSDPLAREPGEALWPEWEDRTALLRRRATIGERSWSALYQQTPRPDVGTLFRTESIDILDASPMQDGNLQVRAWDLAATAGTGGNDPDWTVGIKVGRTRTGRFIILDIQRFRGTPHDVESTVIEAARIDGKAVPIGLPQDPGQAGKHQVSYLARQLVGYRIETSPETGAKLTRAGPVSSQIEAHNFAMLRASWNYAFLEELRNFPFGRKDDQVDALCRAFSMLIESDFAARRIGVPFLER